MADPVKITIPSSIAAFVRPATPLDERLRAAGGSVDLPAHELLLLLFCLSKDGNPEVVSLATATMTGMESSLVLDALGAERFHPAVLHMLGIVRGADSAIRSALLACDELAQVTRMHLEELSAAMPEPACADVEVSDDQSENTGLADDPQMDEDLAADGEDSDIDDEEYLSKYKLAQVMGIGEKIKMALTGDKEWRKILVKDSNKLVSGGVMKNPRMTEPEVLAVLKAGAKNDETIRLICANKEWVKNYQIRKALIENPKTPLANALRYLATMGEKDLASYAKSKNISSVVATQAKRMLLSKKK